LNTSRGERIAIDDLDAIDRAVVGSRVGGRAEAETQSDDDDPPHW